MYQYEHINKPVTVGQQEAGGNALQLMDNRTPIQFNHKKTKKATTNKTPKQIRESKQQSVGDRAYDAMMHYRTDFFRDNNVTRQHVFEYLRAGNKLHGHASDNSNSNENSATTNDADHFVGWFRNHYGEAPRK